MNSAIVLFCRCRPQGCDAIDLVLREKRVFIGYPAWRVGKFLQDHEFHNAVIDLRDPNQDLEALDPQVGGVYKRQISGNRRLVREVDSGAIMLVPRPARGIVYAGRVLEFELVNNPQWGNDYLTLRRAQGLSTDPPGSHLGDVVQGWRVDRWREIPHSAVPAWIRGSLFGRSSLGRIAPLHLKEFQLEPFEVLNHLIEHPEKICPPQTAEPKEIEKRLVTDIGPGTFEHLVVALLQLERPNEIWMHVGGSGDGGVDGVGADRKGRVVGLLQCKWRYDGNELPFEGEVERGRDITRFVAALVHPAGLMAARGSILLDRPKIAELLLKHADRLPWAKSIQVGG
jgi:hypothetical protein